MVNNVIKIHNLRFDTQISLDRMFRNRVLICCFVIMAQVFFRGSNNVKIRKFYN
jgi:hypothetical protein